jgi:hypothetical protein
VGVDGVGVRVNRLGVPVGPLHGQLERERPALVLDLDGDDVGVDRVGALRPDQVLDVVDEAAVVSVRRLLGLLRRYRGLTTVDRDRLDVDLGVGLVEVDVVLIFVRRFEPLVGQRDRQALVEERGLLEPRPDRLEVEVDRLEDVGVRPERDRRTGQLRIGEGLLLGQRRTRHAMVEGHPEGVAQLTDLDVQPGRQGVHYGGAHPVQATRDLVPPATELAAGVQLGEHHLHRGHAFAVQHSGGNAAAVVGDGDPAVGPESDVDRVGDAGQRLVDRVVDDLPHEVVQPALTGRPDVHARALAHRLEALEDLDGRCVVRGRVQRVKGINGVTEVNGVGDVGYRDGRGLRSVVDGDGPGLVGVGHAAPFS